VSVEHTQESENLTSVCVGHALTHGGSVVMRRAVISGGEANKVFCVKLNLVE
jgi:hypothetical protein